MLVGEYSCAKIGLEVAKGIKAGAEIKQELPEMKFLDQNTVNFSFLLMTKI